MLPPGEAPHLGLILKVARHLIETSALCRRRIGRFADDYVGVGYLGLLRAQRAYRTGRGASFATYAFVVIRHFMMLEAFRCGGVRLPTYIAQEAARLAEGLEPTATLGEGPHFAEFSGPQRDDPARFGEIEAANDQCVCFFEGHELFACRLALGWHDPHEYPLSSGECHASAKRKPSRSTGDRRQSQLFKVMRFAPMSGYSTRRESTLPM